MTQRTLKYTIASASGPGQTSYINLARDLSAINRQLFRATRMYKVKSITVVDDDEAKYVQIGVAPNTWAMRNSVKRAYARFNEMNQQVLADNPSIKARWHDFKPYLSLKHFQVETGAAIGTVESVEDMDGNNLQYGEWEFSTFESPDGTSSVDGYKVGILGNHDGLPGSYTYVGLIQSYGDARGTVNSEEPQVNAAVASDDPLVNLLDAGTQFDEIAENIIQEGDQPPYKLDVAGVFGSAYVGASGNMPSECLVAELNSSGDVNGLQRVFGIDVPLGILRIDHALEGDGRQTNFTVIVELAAGDYKGVHAESMV